MVKLTGLILLIVVLLASADGDDSKTAGSQRLLSTRGFKLISRISTGYSHRPKKRQVVQEFYSNVQKRARLQVDRDQFGETHSVYFYDASRKGLFVQHNLDPEAQLKCGQLDDSSFLDALLGALNPVDAEGNASPSRGSDWLRPIGPLVEDVQSPSDHVVGLARIALWIDAHLDQFRPPASEEQDMKVHNVRVKPFTFEGDLGSFPMRASEVVAWYQVAPDERDWLGLPLLAVDIRGQDDDWFYVEFMNVAFMREDLEANMNSRYPLDMFAIPPGIDCTLGMEPAGGWTYAMDDLSFKAELLDYTTVQAEGAHPASVNEQYLAWDSVSRLLRADSYTQHRYTINIIDSTTSTRYSIYHDTHSSSQMEQDARENYESGGMSEWSFGQSQCTKTSFHVKRSSREPLLPFKGMIPLGRARVRGVECRALGALVQELPMALFPPVTYLHEEGLSKTSYQIGEDLKGASYDVVYYFAANPASSSKRWIARRDDESLGSLMRVDVYLRGQLQYQVDVTEFAQGKLADAPNGDRAKELFALRDRCSSGRLGDIDHAKVTAELTLKLNGNSTKATAKDVANSLSSSPRRTRAVVRTLARAARRLMRDLYDVETQLKLTDHDDEMEIYLEARMSRSDVPKVWPKLIGYGVPREPGFVASSADCLAYASLLGSAGSSLMVNCPRRCLVAANPGLEFAADGKQIVGFSRAIFDSVEMTKASDAHCPMLLIEQAEPDIDEEQEFLTQAQWIHSLLRGNTLHLELPGPEAENMEKYGTTSLLVEVNYLDISNDHWSAAVGLVSGTNALMAMDKDSIDGVGLTQASGQNQGVSFRLAAEELAMDFGHCHSLCVARPTCRSFSTCLTARGTECFISELDFRSADFLEQIEQKRAELRSSTDRQVIKVATKGQPAEVELLYDLRCRIHKRSALEMFQKMESVHLNLRNTTLYSVDSLEQCADLCWSNNLYLFNVMDELVERLGENEDSNAVAEKMRAEEAKHHTDWCSHFHYLNLAYSSDLDWVATLKKEKDLDKAGLCVPIKPLAYKERHAYPMQQRPTSSDLAKNPRPAFEKFDFMYRSLFNVEYGKRIAETRENRRMRRQTRLLGMGEEFCARVCFLQTEQLIPRCKSFDMVETKLISTGKMVRYCVLNSDTIEDLEKRGQSSMVADTSSTGAPSEDTDEMYVRSWHFEPKLHAMATFMIARRAVSRVENEESSSLALAHYQSIRVHGLGLFLLTLASVACTALIVKLHGGTVVAYFSAPRRGSVASLAGSLDNF